MRMMRGTCMVSCTVMEMSPPLAISSDQEVPTVYLDTCGSYNVWLNPI